MSGVSPIVARIRERVDKKKQELESVNWQLSEAQNRVAELSLKAGAIEAGIAEDEALLAEGRCPEGQAGEEGQDARPADGHGREGRAGMNTNEEIHDLIFQPLNLLEQALAEWDPKVAAMIGPGIAKYEAMRGKILCPEERLAFLAGYNCCQEKFIDQLSALRARLA